MIDFFIPCQVTPKQGDRSSIAATKSGRRFVRHYQPKNVVKNAEAISALAAYHRPAKPLEGPVRLSLQFYFPWRKSDSKRYREPGYRPMDTKPDLDNLAKQMCDVLQRCGFFRNDSQICDISIRKGRSDVVGVRVTVESVE